MTQLKTPKGLSLDELSKKNHILVIEEGFFKGRMFIIDKELAKKPVTWGMVEDGRIFGQPKFSPACFVHDKFISSSGCDECEPIENKE